MSLKTKIKNIFSRANNKFFAHNGSSHNDSNIKFFINLIPKGGRQSDYQNLGFVCVEWFDACQHDRARSLEQCYIVPQKTIGYGYLNKRNKSIIVVFDVAEGLGHFNALAIPSSWIQNIRRLWWLKEARKDYKI